MLNFNQASMMHKYSGNNTSNGESSNSSESDTNFNTKESRSAGGNEDNGRLERNGSALVSSENQYQYDIKRVLVQILTKFVAFILNFVPSTFVLDQTTAQQTQSQPRLHLTNGLKNRMKNCKHPAHKNLANTALIREIPTWHFEQIVEKDIKDNKFIENEVAKASNSLNERLIERLLEIEERAPMNIELKLLSYQEWVDMLLKINKALLKNLCELEHEFLCKIRDSADKSKLVKSYKADIIRLIEFIRQAQTEDDWSLRDFVFETFERTDIFDKRKIQFLDLCKNCENY